MALSPEILAFLAFVATSLISAYLVPKLYWRKFKARLSQVRVLIDQLDDGLKDDSLTPEEIAALEKAIRDLLSPLPF